MQQAVRKVNVEQSVAEYLLRLTHATRTDPRLKLAISPRGSLTLYRTSQAYAFVNGRNFVLPEDIRALAKPVLAHRVMLETKTKYGGASAEEIVSDILKSVTAPR